MDMDNTEEASQYHLSAVQLASRMRDPVRQRVAIGNLGICRHAQKDYTLATECLEVQLARGTSARSRLVASKALASIAQEQGNQERAMDYSQAAYQLAKETNDQKNQHKAQTQLGISIGNGKMEEHMRAAAVFFNQSATVEEEYV
jgi:tetratricopeptide (TPR) repeat protein